ncbi:20638_t:CDS:2, partial [Cetraspora pellucida]
DRHTQTPQDAYHSLTGKAHIEKPTNWYRMPNPLRHHQSFMFSDVLRIAMLMLFILRRFLKPNHVKTEIKNNWRARQISS